MDINFFEPLDKPVAKLDNSYNKCVQIQNTSGGMLHIAEGFYLRNYEYALISKDNPKFEKFLKLRKVKVHEFTVSKTAKKKKTVEVKPEVQDGIQETEQSIDIQELSAMFTIDKSKFEVENNGINQDEI